MARSIGMFRRAAPGSGHGRCRKLASMHAFYIRRNACRVCSCSRARANLPVLRDTRRRAGATAVRVGATAESLLPRVHALAAVWPALLPLCVTPIHREQPSADGYTYTFNSFRPAAPRRECSWTRPGFASHACIAQGWTDTVHPRAPPCPAHARPRRNGSKLERAALFLPCPTRPHAR
jgi:hypothetical protein